MNDMNDFTGTALSLKIRKMLITIKNIIKIITKIISVIEKEAIFWQKKPEHMLP